MMRFLRVFLRSAARVGFLAVLAGWIVNPVWAEESPYRANEEGNLVQIVSPYGSKLLFGQSGFSKYSHYRFEIPIRDLATGEGGGRGVGGGGGSGSGSGSGGARVPYEENNDQLVFRANELYNQGKFADALTFVEEVLLRDPKHTRSWVMKGSLMHAMGNKDQARKAWQKALELEPGNETIQEILRRYQ